MRTSSATTAKPLPCWPARAASMAAFSASRLVWSAMRATALTTSPILAACASRSCTRRTEASCRSAALPMAPREAPIWPDTLPTRACSPSVFFSDVSAFSRAFTISPAPWFTAFNDCAAAFAASSAPEAICAVARCSSAAAELASAMPLASCEVAAATRSAAFCWRAKVRALRFCASASRPGAPADVVLSERSTTSADGLAATPAFFTRAMVLPGNAGCGSRRGRTATRPRHSQVCARSMNKQLSRGIKRRFSRPAARSGIPANDREMPDNAGPRPPPGTGRPG